MADAVPAPGVAPVGETKPVTPVVPAPAPVVTVEKKEAVKPLEKYSLKAPDGFEVDAAALEKFASWSHERGLTESQAKDVLARNLEERKAEQESQRNMLKEQDVAWKEELIKKAGGQKQFEAMSEHAKRFFDWLDADGSLRKDLENAGLSNWPRIVELAAAKGKAMAEDKLPAGANGVPSKPKSVEERLRERYAGKAE